MACWLISYHYTAWLVVQSDPVNIVESCGCGDGCGHCGNDVMEACMATYDGALSCGQPLWHRMVMHMVTL